MEIIELATSGVGERIECPYAGCSGSNSPDAKYCGRCGRQLTAQAAPIASRSVHSWFPWLAALVFGLYLLSIAMSPRHNVAIGLVAFGFIVVMAKSRRKPRVGGRRRCGW